MQDKCF